MREPDLTIGPKDDPQTLRWHLLRWRGVQIALHRWLRSDGDRALHDHSAGNVSILLTGTYREHFSHSWQPAGHVAHLKSRLRLPFIPYYRRADQPHRVELVNGPVWSIWIRFKPWRDWGFYCPKGWTHWKDFIDGDYSNPGATSQVGRGCG